MAAERPKLGFVVASSITVNAFLAPHMERLSKAFDIALFVNASSSSFPTLPQNVRTWPVPIERDIAIVSDVRALLALYKNLRREKLSLVFSQTPKAGLLTGLAAFAARVPVRVHCFTGQVWATRRGLARFILKSADRLIAALATHTLADSQSQRDFLLANRVVAPERIEVLAHGSICGVDIERFKPNAIARAEIRAKLGIPEDAKVFLFVGRFNREKGIRELAEAFACTAAKRSNIHLVLVGPDEGKLAGSVEQVCAQVASRVHIHGHTSRPEDFMAMANVLCLPSYREGFGSVIIEAAACGIPAIGTRIYGVSDAIVHGETGLLVGVQNIEELASAIDALAADDALLERLANAARKRALNEFRAEVVVGAMEDFIKALVQTGGK